MRQTIEAFQETAAELDQRYAGNRLANAIAAIAIAELLIGTTTVAAHHIGQQHEVAISDGFHADTVRENIVATIPSTEVVPKPVTLPHSSHHAREHPKPHASSLRPAVGYQQIILPMAPPIKRAGHRFTELLAEPKPQEETVADISWPQCESQTDAERAADKRQGYTRFTDHVKKALKTIQFDYLMIGANAGHSFSTNRCLKEELDLTKHGGLNQHHGIYLNSNYPGYAAAKHYRNTPNHCKTSDRICVARNYGVQAGRYAVLAVYRAGGVAPDGWEIDVETGNKWEGTPAEHVAVIQGMTEALHTASPTSTIIYYSVTARAATANKKEAPGMWKPLMGNWQPKNVGSWIAGGNNTPAGALESCTSRPSINDKPNVMSQYVHNGIDWDIICPTPAKG